MKVVFRCNKPNKRFIIKLWFDKNGILEHVFAWYVLWFSVYADADADTGDEYVIDSVLEFLSNLLREEDVEMVIEE
jgi:hypothetical protein